MWKIQSLALDQMIHNWNLNKMNSSDDVFDLSSRRIYLAREPSNRLWCFVNTRPHLYFRFIFPIYYKKCKFDRYLMKIWTIFFNFIHDIKQIRYKKFIILWITYFLWFCWFWLKYAIRVTIIRNFLSSVASNGCIHREILTK